MKLKFAFGIASAAMLLCACGDDSVTNINDEAKDKGMVTLKVVDYNTGSFIDSAEVYSLIDARTEYTDSLGTVNWKNKDIGDYEYTVSKDGYATRTVKVSLVENSGGDMARVEDRISEVKMFKKGVSVKGTVLLKDPHTGNLSAASKVKVLLSYENDFIVPSEIATYTDSSGVYEFKNLAEGLEYAIRVPQASKDGKTYAWPDQKNVNQPLRSGEQRVLDQVTMEVVGLNPELVNDNLLTIDPAESVRLTFSTMLLADSVPTSWKVYKGSMSNVGYYINDFGEIVYYDENVCSAGTSVLTSANLDEDGKTVVISPISEKWTRLASYCISGAVFTSEGKRITVSKTFVPGSAVSRPNLVTKLSASEYYDRYIKLTWEPTGEEIKGYRVYFKTSESADFEEYKAWQGGELPIDSVSCKNVTSQTNCEQYAIRSSANRTETNYWWYTKYNVKSNDNSRYDADDVYYGDSMSTTYSWYTRYDTTEVTSMDAYTTSTYKYIWPDGSECYASSYSYCDQYDYYGSSYESRTYVYLSVGAADSVQCAVGNGYSYTSCDQYMLYGAPNRTSYVYYKKVASDSSYCTVQASGLVDSYATNAKCLSLASTYGNYARTDYNYWWYTETVPVKPTATSDMAFIPTNSVVTSTTTSVKFIVLPYVVVGGDTVMADAVPATPAEYKVSVGQ